MATIGSMVVELSANTAKLEAALKQTNSHLHNMGNTWKRVGETMLGFSFANFLVEGAQKVKDFISESARLGLEAQVQEEAFARVTSSVGANAQALLSGLQRVSGGILNISDVMTASSKALQQGLAPEQLVGLMEIARSQARVAGTDVTTAFNSITTAVTTQMPRALKQFGIILDLNRAYEEHARRLGTVKEALTETGQSQALAIAAQEAMRNKLIITGDSALNNSEKVQKMAAAWKQLKEDVGTGIINALAEVHDVLSKFPKIMTPPTEEQRSGWMEFFKVFLPAPLAGTYDALVKLAKFTMPPKMEIPVEMGGEAVLAGPKGTPKSTPKSDQIDQAREAIGRANRVLMESDKEFRLLDISAEQYSARLQAIIRALAPFKDSNEDAAKSLFDVRLRLGELEGTGRARIEQWDREFRAMDEFNASLTALARAEEEERTIKQSLIDLAEAGGPIVLEFGAAVKAGASAFGELSGALEAGQIDLDEVVQRLQIMRDVLEGLRGKPGVMAEDLNAALGSIKGGLKEANMRLLAKGLPGADLNAPTEDDLSAMLGTMPEGLSEAQRQAAKAGADLRESLRRIGQEAKILGPDFDSISASIAATKEAMRVLIAQGTAPATEDLKALKTQLDELKRIETLREVFTSTFDSIRSGISETLRGVMQGTQTWGEGMKNMFRNIGLSIAQNFIDLGLKKIQSAMLDMVTNMVKPTGGAGGGGGWGAVLGGLFGGGGAAAAPAMMDVGMEGLAMFQHGGIAKRPTLGVFGEAGPEALIPLNSLQDVGPSEPLVKIEIIDQRSSGADIERREQTTPDGKLVQFIIRDAVKNGIRNGEFDRDLGTTFGLARRGVNR